MFNRLAGTLKEETETSGILSLSQMAENFDAKFDELDKKAILIAANTKLTQFRLGEGGYYSSEAVRELEKYVIAGGFIRGTLLHYFGQQKIFTDDAVYTLNTFFEHIYTYDHWDSTRFLTEGLTDGPYLRPIEDVTINGVERVRIATYIRPVIKGGQPVGVVLFFVNEKDILDAMRSVIPESSGYIFVENDGQPIAAYVQGEAGVDTQEVWQSVKDSPMGASYQTIGRSDYCVIHLPGKSLRLSYTLVVPTSQLMHKANRSLRDFVIFAALLSLIGLIVSFMFTWRNYTPLKRLIKVLSLGQHGLESQYHDFSAITTKVSEITSENTGLMRQINQNQDILRKQLFATLYHRKSGEPVAEDMITFSNIQFYHNRFVVALLTADELTHISKKDTVFGEMLAFSIINVFEELLSALGQCFGQNEGGNVALLVDLQPEKDMAELYEALEQGIAFFMNHFDIAISSGVGAERTELEAIKDAYEEAHKALLYRTSKGTGKVIPFSLFKEENSKETLITSDMKDLLIKGIKRGEPNEACLAVSVIAQRMLDNQTTEKTNRDCWLDLFRKIIEVCGEVNIAIDKKTLAYVSDFLEERNMQVLKTEEVLRGFCSEICLSLNEQRESKNYDLRDRILLYVQENYRASHLNVETIAGVFGISPAYLSRFFKDHTGNTIMKHIDQLRMKEAKRLLVETNCTLKEIVAQIGSFDDANFIRKFKQREGLTPMNYRRQFQGCQKNNEEE